MCTYLCEKSQFCSVSGYKITNQIGKLFLSWQTRDLLKLTFYGLKSLCEDFTTTHLSYSIYAILVNGSAVETLFSQIKHTTSGNLSSSNYPTARAAIMTKGSIHSKMRHHHGDYRNVPLYIWGHALQCKPVKKNQKSWVHIVYFYCKIIVHITIVFVYIWS